MATLSFDQVWEAVRTMPPDELQRLRNLLEALATQPRLGADAAQLSPDDQFLLEMLQEGSIVQVPRGYTEEERRAAEAFRPVPIEGEPISETIIRERR